MAQKGCQQSEAIANRIFPLMTFSDLCRILAQDSVELTRKILRLGALSSLLYAMGNMEFSDSQRQASLTLEYLCQTYPVIDRVVREAMGPSMHDEFTNSPDAHFHQMTPLQADVLVSNKVTYLGEGI